MVPPKLPLGDQVGLRGVSPYVEGLQEVLFTVALVDPCELVEMVEGVFLLRTDLQLEFQEGRVFFYVHKVLDLLLEGVIPDLGAPHSPNR